MVLGNLSGGAAHAKADLQVARCLAAKNLVPIRALGHIVDTPERPTILDGRRLSFRKAAFTAHKTTNTAKMLRQVTQNGCALFSHGVSSVVAAGFGVVADLRFGLR